MRSALFLTVITILISFEVQGNDVQPRLYSNVPVGVNFISVGYANSDGEITFDNSIPVEDVEGSIDSLLLSYSRGVNIAGKSAMFTIAVPYADVSLEGLYLGEPTSGQRQGMGDPQIRLSVNFYGAPATSRKQYAA